MFLAYVFFGLPCPMFLFLDNQRILKTCIGVIEYVDIEAIEILQQHTRAVLSYIFELRPLRL